MLKLVYDNDFSFFYFNEYKDAVDFVFENVNHSVLFPPGLNEQNTIKNFSRICDEMIDVYEPNEGKNRYKVRIRK